MDSAYIVKVKKEDTHRREREEEERKEKHADIGAEKNRETLGTRRRQETTNKKKKI